MHVANCCVSGTGKSCYENQASPGKASREGAEMRIFRGLFGVQRICAVMRKKLYWTRLSYPLVYIARLRCLLALYTPVMR